MATLRDLLRELIEELIKTQTPGSFPEKVDGVTVMSGFISTGQGGSLMLSRPMEQLISQIAQILRQNAPTVFLSHTEKEWLQLVRGAFGPPLALIDLTDDLGSNADQVLAAVRQTLSESTVKGSTCEYAFGCTLFASKAVEAFAIGPVRFEARLEWLARKLGEGAVTAIMARRLRRRWAGQKNRKRKHLVDGMRETDIVDAVGSCDYICSVMTGGLASQAGEMKSRTAARLALTAIAIWWEVPSRALDGMNLLVDRTVRIQRSLAFVPGKITLSGGTLLGRPHGPPISPKEWADLLARVGDELKVVGELIEFYLSPTGAVGRPKLMNALAQALLWFHEGCREQVDLMAIVKFAATLDALASGGESSGILKLIQARLGPKPSDPIRANGQTAKQGVEEIYSKGRSRTMHGTNENLGHDWTSTRGFSEVIARYCLISCLGWAATNASDDPKLLLQ
ncbi:hypothetical protein RFM23_20940 [Mesorhizobium abyssinicae]|uniref:Apea-like HEPN domain-containing protein n=1 Tax=Mesorhizobium abyssinicae TaxID=1209958 RepID=A0ABU5AS20_9HYPH|nr:hypothetical protein [Mesorhizobium abyssinicae]MDX8540090.1 hypothetical protein [Mesorhizobium abyssinicae]